jgi:small subunit ribosomal protein S2
MIDLRRLIKAGIQFGHQHKWGHPKSRRFLWGQRNGIDLIDVSQTATMLETAAQFLEKSAREGKEILWCGTKKAAQKAMEPVEKAGWPVIRHRWVGGTFTNPNEVRKAVRKLVHNKDILAKSDRSHFTKKELSVLHKVTERLSKTVGGIEALKWPVGALVVIDVRKEHVAVKEAIACGIPVIALVDTNASPDGILYPIPANDDGEESVYILVGEYLLQAATTGKEQYRERTQQALADATAAQGAVAVEGVPAGEGLDKSHIDMQLAAVEAALDQDERETGSRKTSGAKAPLRRPQSRSKPEGGAARGGGRPPKRST